MKFKRGDKIVSLCRLGQNPKGSKGIIENVYEYSAACHYNVLFDKDPLNTDFAFAADENQIRLDIVETIKAIKNG